MKVTRTPAIALLAAALAVPVFAGCSNDDESAEADSAKPVTLRIGTDDEPGTPAADQIQELARRVSNLSGGEITIKPVWHAAGDGPDWDQRVARMVTGGGLDMGLIPSRAWDTEGVESLRALNAPFLVTSDALMAEVISGDLAGDLMSGLGEANVVGIALFPEGMRHPFGLERPLFGPDDYAGQTIRSATSKTTAAVFEALGASVNDAEADQKVHAGLDSSYLLQPGGTATGNVTFYPKVNSLVMGSEAYEALDEDQREVLAKAAAQTRDWAIRSGPSDAEAARSFCRQGGAVVNASEADLAALEDATAPVYAELDRDQRTKELIAAIRELKQSTTVAADAPVACGAQPKAGGGPGADAVDGVYRFRVTDKELRAEGVTDRYEIDQNHGVYTMTLSGGEYCWKQKAPNYVENDEDCDTYELDGDRMVFRFPDALPDVYRWKQAANGDLRFTVLSAAPGDLPIARAWTAGGWQRTGDAKWAAAFTSPRRRAGARRRGAYLCRPGSRR
jgi:TRAP-type C4-dicarboxylate transport system substrate-binding protein